MSNDTYLHGFHESVLKSHSWRTAQNSASYLLPNLQSGMDLLDVGCGPGTISIDLAQLVQPGGVIGIDNSAAIIETANKNASEKEIPNLKFQVGDIYDLDFEDNQFDVIHAHQVLQHLSDPLGALAEMRRVCKPTGIVAARDVDFGLMGWYPTDPILDQFLISYRKLAKTIGAQPDAGRYLLAWANEAGFSYVDASASTWCFNTEQDKQWWGNLWAQRITTSKIATQMIQHHIASQDQLQDYANAWKRWIDDPNAWTVVVHGQILARP